MDRTTLEFYTPPFLIDVEGRTNPLTVSGIVRLTDTELTLEDKFGAKFTVKIKDIKNPREIKRDIEI